MSSSLVPIDITSRTGRHIGFALVSIFLLIWVIAVFTFRAECEKAGRENPHQPTMHDSSKHVPVHDWPTAIYRGLQLFHYHDTHWPEPQGGGGLGVRYAAAVYALALPAFLVGWVFRGGLARWWHQRMGKAFVVVIGEAYGARQLVQDIAKNRERPVVWVRQARKHGSEEQSPSGVLTMDGDLGDAAFWRNLVRVDKAAETVLMAGTDSENIELSLVLEKALGKTARTEPLPCHIQLADLHLKKGLSRLLPPESECKQITRFYFSQYEIMARLLARMQPLPGNVAEKSASSVHYIIVGFDALGQNVALKLAKMGQQVVRRIVNGTVRFDVVKPRITVIDKRGEQAASMFLRAHSGFREICDFQMLPHDCSDREFLELAFLQGQPAAQHTALIYCLIHEPTVATAILAMLDVCERPESHIDAIYYVAAHEQGVGHLLHRWQNRLNEHIPMYTFAADKEVFTEDVILNRSLDLMARRIHDEYRGIAGKTADEKNPAPAADKDWMSLTEEEREGNREPADHLWAKLRTLGYRLETLPFEASKEAVSTEDPTIRNAIDCHLEELASSEHYRWMAWRLVNGWIYNPIRNDDDKLHPDLVAYEHLKESDKEKDRVIVRIIPDLIRAGRLRLLMPHENKGEMQDHPA